MFTVAVIALTIIAGSVVSVREALRAKAAEQSALAAQWKEAEQRRQAEEQWKRAERERASARLNEYIADIGLAQQALNAGNLGRAVQLLEKHRPQSGEADQRGWDWRYLWRLAQGDEHVAFPDHPGPANTIAFSKSGDLVAIGGQQQTTICDPRTRALVATLPHASETVAFLDTGMLLTFGRGRLVLWRTDDWSEHASWKEGFGPVALSPDGRRLAVVTREGTRIRDTATWKETRFVTGASGAVAFSPDGNTLAAHGTAGVTLWRLDDEQNIRVLADSAGLMGPGGGFQSSQQLLFAGTSLVAVQNNPSERGVFLLRIWDTRTGQEIVVMPNDPERPEHTGAITSLAASADGNTLVTTSLDHSVRLWDLTRYRRSAIVQGHRAEVCGGAFAPDGATLLTCDRAGQIKAWAVRRETMESILPEAMRPLGFSSDGHLLAALTQENAITFYDSATRQLPARHRTDARPARRDCAQRQF